MIAQQCDRAARYVVDQGIQHPFRVGAVSDEIAQEHELFRSVLRSVGQAGFESLPVGVDVGHQGDRHGDVDTASAWSISHNMSSIDSMPIDRRTISGRTPAVRCSCSDNCRWVVEAG